MAELKAVDLVKSFGSKRVINKVTISVKMGEIVGLLGPNGAGKTTTFYSVVGLIKPDHGSIYIHDRNITDLPMYKRARIGIGYLPQESSIFRKMTVKNNIMCILEIIDKGTSKVEKTRRADELLDELNILHLKNNRAYLLSGGEKRRVEICRALATSPSFILLDEPFAGIDPIAITDIQQIIFHLKSRDIGVLITDHNVRETLQITDRTYIINDGNIIDHGDPQYISKSEKARKIYLGDKFSL